MTEAACAVLPDDGRGEGTRRLARLVPATALAVVVGVLLGRFLFLEPVGDNGVADRFEVNPSPAALLLALEARVDRAPDDAAAWQQLAAAATTQGIESGDIALFVRASDAVIRAERLAPEAFGTRFARASLALTLHEFATALEHGRVALERNPFSAEALGVVVDAQVELGLYDGAATDLQRMLDLDPGLPALARTSYLRELHGDLPGALQAMQQAEAAGVDTGYRTAVTAALVGRLHARLGDEPAARAAYDRALAAEPGFEPAIVGVASLDAAAGDVGGALARLEGIAGPGAAAATLLGDLHRLRGDDAAAAAADDLVRQNHADEERVGHVTDLDRAIFEIDRSGDPEAALELARVAHAARPDNVAASDALAWALVRAGRPADALPHVERALRLGSADQSFRVHAAAALAATGQPDRAAVELRAALDGPWTTFVLTDVAADLAEQLGVPLPADWPSVSRP